MSVPATLRVDFLPLQGLSRQSAPWWKGVLGVVGFETAPELDRTRSDIPVTASSTPLLGSDQPLCEVWRADDVQTTKSAAIHRSGRVRYRHDGKLLFGCVRIEESASSPGQPGSAIALRTATEQAYAELFAVVRQAGYPYLIRVWNYLPDINAHCDGDERYRHFNSARQSAFAQAGSGCASGFPAASALGCQTGSPVSIHFLAARDMPLMLENPRQISAYHYPRQYGEHSPLFSRACILAMRGDAYLFLSGTASILGHQTMHPGDVKAQTRESMTNITALIEEANRSVHGRKFLPGALKYKVYVRRHQDQPSIASELGRWLQGPASVVYLQADVCREDLLVEIEASGTATVDGA